MNPNDIRIRRVYTREAAIDVVDDSLPAASGNYELVVEWEAGQVMNGAQPQLNLAVATCDLCNNCQNVGALTFTRQVTTDGTGANKKYEEITAIPANTLGPDHIYECCACLIHPTIPMHSYSNTWTFVGY